MTGWMMGLLWALLSLSSGEVVVRWDASTTTPKIGEPFQVSLVVTYGDDVKLVGWDRISRQWGDFEILSHDVSWLISGQQMEQFTAVLWQVDDVQTPDLTVQYQIVGDDRIREVSPERLSFSVLSVLGGQDVVLRANTAPIQPFYIPQIVWWGGGLGALLLAGVIYQVIKRRTKITDDEIGQPLAEGWRYRSRTGLSDSIAPINDYLSQKLGYPVESLTHHELLQRVGQQSIVSPQHINRLAQLLDRYDYYNFSSENADTGHVEQFRQYAERWVAMAIDEAGQS